MNKTTIVVIIFIGILGLGLFLFKKINGGSKKDSLPTRPIKQESEKIEEKQADTPSLPKMEIDKTKTYQAIFDTSDGEFTATLYGSKMPITVNNFVSLAKAGFYNNTIFHRVISGFMIQGGDPKGNGTGGPGYQFDDEPFEGEYTRGTMAMANSGPNTNGSQFFIMHQDYPLPKNYVIFGKVIQGLEIVDKIANAPVVENSFGEKSKPDSPVTINSISIKEL